ncbi:MAG: UvrD-helicase domain-containing protein, partial [Chloroflexi bacterium]|nr:UvrD-helicase domain-containing protein [Chloroflexota bacterium]
MDLLDGLNKQQREAAETVEGPLLIIAGPGSGKTRVITHRIAYLVRVCGVLPYRITAMTFTNKAAREMKERLFGKSDQDPAAPLLRDYWDKQQDFTVSTFHAFCASILRREGHHIGLDRSYTIYDDEDQIDLLKRSMEEVSVDPKHFAPRAILSAISGAKSQLIDAQGFAMKRQSYFDEIVHRVYERYQDLLSQSQALDFDDLLLKTHLLFDGTPDVLQKYQSRYAYLLIDEFQDTNVAQYAIARQLAQKHGNICVVGDPDQSIYSWRNADIRNILSFQNDYPHAKVVTLEENYRSTKTILEAARHLIALNRQRVEKNLWTNNGRGRPIVISEAYNEEDEAQFVIRETEQLVERDGYPRGDIAVMYRINAQSRALEEACLRYGVPYQLVGGTKFYQRREVKDVIAYLRLIVNPHDDVSLARIINIPPRGIGQRTVDNLARWARETKGTLFSAIETLTSQPQEGEGSTAPFPSRTSRALVSFDGLIQALTKESDELEVVKLIEEVLERTGYGRHIRDGTKE